MTGQQEQQDAPAGTRAGGHTPGTGPEGAPPGASPPSIVGAGPEGTPPGASLRLSEAALRERLTPEQYRVLREGATERPGTGFYLDTEDRGVYRCAACGNALFGSDAKFHSGSGWPSFWEPVNPDSLEEIEDRSHGMVRTEVRCGRCHSHLGHLFPDGPRPTGLRYCINSLALDLDAEPPVAE